MNFSIDTFMTKGLRLSKTELLVFALIHNYSQDGQGCYWGSIPMTAEILNCSENSVRGAIKALTKRHLIDAVGIHPSYHTTQYIATPPAGIKARFSEGAKIEGGCKFLPPKGAKIEPLGVQKLNPIINTNNKYNLYNFPDFDDTIRRESLQEKMKRYESA